MRQLFQRLQLHWTSKSWSTHYQSLEQSLLLRFLSLPGFCWDHQTDRELPILDWSLMRARPVRWSPQRPKHDFALSKHRLSIIQLRETENCDNVEKLCSVLLSSWSSAVSVVVGCYSDCEHEAWSYWEPITTSRAARLPAAGSPSELLQRTTRLLVALLPRLTLLLTVRQIHAEAITSELICI